MARSIGEIKADIDRKNEERNIEVAARSKHDKRQRELKGEIEKLTAEFLSVVNFPPEQTESPKKK